MRKILVFSGTRADYSLLRNVLHHLSESPNVAFELLISGSHLSNKFGRTVEEINKDSFCPTIMADIGLDDESDILAIMSRALAEYGKILSSVAPDLVLVPGDRYEAFCMVVAASMRGIPVAHLFGGCVTEGAIDDYFRHSMTKMSHLHFTSCETHSMRIRQLGEDPSHIYTVGSTGVENTRLLPVMSREEILEILGLPQDADYFLLTLHPVTLGSEDTLATVRSLHKILREQDTYYVFTGANADENGEKINEYLLNACKDDPKLRFFMSLGVKNYINASRHARAVLGNSSSITAEVPGLGVPVLNIGTRQDGRTISRAVLHSGTAENELRVGIKEVLSPEALKKAKTCANPLDIPGTSENIARILASVDLNDIRMKKFRDLPMFT